MVTYRQWKLVNESLGLFPLGVRSKTNLGVVTDQPLNQDPAVQEVGLASMDNATITPAPKRPLPRRPLPQQLPRDEEEPEDREDEEEPEDREDEDMPSDEEGDEEEENDPDMEPEEEKLTPRKRPVGEPHDSSAFMRRECQCDKEGDEEQEEKDPVAAKEGIKPSFLQKKCPKCKKMKEDYDPDEENETDIMAKLIKQYMTVKEDALIQEPAPGEVAYAPQTRVGGETEPGMQNISESIKSLKAQVARLEKQLKRRSK